MSDPQHPGTGPDIPEPEDENFRQEQIDAENERRQAEMDERKQRSEDAKAFYSGDETEEAPAEPETMASRPNPPTNQSVSDS